MVDGTQQILNELRELRIDIGFIKENMVTEEDILSQDDVTSLAESERDFEKGETKRLE